jgi:endonuclease/exonuclease/phosphatase family metal-dependent hydrolase
MTRAAARAPATPTVPHRRLTRLLLVALLAVAPAAVAVQPVTANSASLAFLQFNMCGNACGTHLTVVADVESSINGHSPQPFVVTLNEVCRSQYGKLYADLLPYYGHFEPTITGRCWDGSDYGIAILLRTSSYTYLGSWPLPNPAGTEPRKMSCLQTNVAGASQPLVACVTHIDTSSANIPSQISSVASRARGFWSGHKVLVGGDFNTTPGASALNPMYSTQYSGGTGVFNEADSGNFSRGGGGTGSAYNEYTGGCLHWPCGYRANDWKTQRKIDYVFLSRYDFISYSADASYSLHSDHVPLWASAVIT